MNMLIVLAVLGLIALALWSKWKSVPLQTRQMILMMFGAAKTYRQVQKQMKKQSAGQTQTAGRANYDPSASKYRQSEKPQQNTSYEERPVSGQLMIACASCGLHIPQNEAVRVNGKDYCCAEHAQ